jgi:hypothetical protein
MSKIHHFHKTIVKNRKLAYKHFTQENWFAIHESCTDATVTNIKIAIAM